MINTMSVSTLEGSSIMWIERDTHTYTQTHTLCHTHNRTITNSDTHSRSNTHLRRHTHSGRRHSFSHSYKHTQTHTNTRAKQRGSEAFTKALRQTFFSEIFVFASFGNGLFSNFGNISVMSDPNFCENSQKFAKIRVGTSRSPSFHSSENGFERSEIKRSV